MRMLRLPFTCLAALTAVSGVNSANDLNKMVQDPAGVYVIMSDYLWGGGTSRRPAECPSKCTMDADCCSNSCKGGLCGDVKADPICSTEPVYDCTKVPYWCPSKLGVGRKTFSGTLLQAELLSNDPGPGVYTAADLGLVLSPDGVDARCFYATDGLTMTETLTSEKQGPIDPWCAGGHGPDESFCGERAVCGCGPLVGPKSCPQSCDLKQRWYQWNSTNYTDFFANFGNPPLYAKGPSMNIEALRAILPRLLYSKLHGIENNEAVLATWAGMKMKDLPIIAFLSQPTANLADAHAIRDSFESYTGKRLPIVQWNTSTHKFASLESSTTPEVFGIMTIADMDTLQFATTDNTSVVPPAPTPSPSAKTREKCTDKNPKCSHWAAQKGGECESNPGYMKMNCERSCNLCLPDAVDWSEGEILV